MILLFCFCFIDITGRKVDLTFVRGPAIASKLEDWRYCICSFLFRLFCRPQHILHSFACFLFQLRRKRQFIFQLFLLFIKNRANYCDKERERTLYIVIFAFFLFKTLALTLNFFFYLMSKLWLVMEMAK